MSEIKQPRYRAIKDQFDLLYDAVEDTRTPRQYDKPGEGEILCYCHDEKAAEKIAAALNIADTVQR